MTTDGQPDAWLVAGHPNSGKSTLGRALAAELGATLLDQDVLTNPLVAELARLLGAGADLDHPGLRGSVRTARYQCVLDTAADNLAVGRPVVVVAPFTREMFDPAEFARVADQLAPATVRLVWVEVPAAVTADRRVRRNLPRDAAGTRATRPSGRPAVPHLSADGTADPAAESRRLVRRSRSPGFVSG